MRDSIRRLLRHRKAAVGGSILLGFLVLALTGPWLVMDPSELVGRPHQPPSRAHLLGTTGQGQDVLAQTVVGARATLAVGFAVGALVTLVGALAGVTAGYLGRRVDDVLSLATNIFLVIPGLPLAIVLGAYLPSGPLRMVVVLVLAGWAWNARVFRAEALSLRGRDFVAAAVVSGESGARIVTRELLPNMASLLGSSFIGNTLYAVGAQVGLEFLGLGDVGSVTWGTNLYWAANDAALLTRSWWIFVPTGLCIALVGFSLTLLSSAIDELANPALRTPPALPASPAAVPVADPPAPGGALLSVRELCIDYAAEGGPRRVVDSVSFDLAPGEVFGLAGESGSGKSTIGSALLRLLPPSARITRGRILFDGTDVTALDGAALRAFRWRQVSMVFQSAMSALNPVLTLGEQFHDTLVAHGRSGSRAASRARAMELLAMVGLAPERVDAWPHQLSGGMRQRAGIALALALEPRLVVMDEPTTALDVVVQKELLQRLLELKERLGFSILFITHDLPLLLALADRVGILQGGRLVEVDTAARLRTEPRHPYTRLLLSSFPHLGAGGWEEPVPDLGVPAPPHLPVRAALSGGRP